MRRRLLIAPLLLLFFAALPARPASAHQLCFAGKTPHCLNDPFSDYWEANGGLPVFGYPITAAANEANKDTGKTYLTQWVERNRLEDHPENQGTPYRVLLGLLGKERLAQLGRNAANEPRESGPKAGCLWFEQTGHNVCNQGGSLGFKRYWESNGLKIAGLDNYARSLQLFGLPLTEPKLETNSSGDTVLTQWFERARFEWHPGNPDQFKVLLGLLGKEVNGGTTPNPPPAGVSVVSHSSYTDSIGAYWIVGEIVNNTGSNQESIKIVASLYDSGSKLLGSDFGFAELSIVKPGQRAPFSIVVLEPPAGLSRYALQVEGRATTRQPLDQFAILSKGDRDAGLPGSRYIFGELRNDTGASVEFVKVVATLYNASGGVVQVEFAYTDLRTLAPGQATTFEIAVLEWNGATRYELQAQGLKE